MRALFIIRDLPRPTISTAALMRGEEPLSGTHTSGLLVAEGLARRGQEIGVFIVHGQRIVDSTFRTLSSAEAAAEWIQDGRVIWLTYGDESVLEKITTSGLRPLVWTQLPVSRKERAWLESGVIAGLITVSDTCRIPLLRSPNHELVGRIYNPLAPLFQTSVSSPPGRFERRLVAYAGAAGPTKGLHRLLQMWRYVHRSDPIAKLVLAGTGRLYGSTRELGRHGIADPQFEAHYVDPLIREFGSLAAAGIELAGLLDPTGLRNLYADASIGIVNMNWSEYTETFCCAGVEMLSVGLPVFSVARAALPETLGRSGGAILTHQKRLDRAAAEFGALLSNPAELSRLGAIGQRFVRTEYDLNAILGAWEKVLSGGARIAPLSGRWQGPRSLQYWLESAASCARAPWLLDIPARGLRALKQMVG